MAYSYFAYTGNGSNTQFNIPFNYIRREHVFATVAGSSVTFTWVNASTIQMDATPAAAAVVRVYRETPLAAPLVDFTDGATLVATDLDTNAKQSIYIQQELDDSLVDGLANVIPNGDKGDITTSSAGTVWTIDTGAVTSAKILNDTILNADVNSTAGIDASKLSFLQAGTSPVARTIDSKLKDVVSVFDFIPQAEHAAIKSGASTYDAVAAINAAIAAGRKIIVPPGTYQLKSFSIPYESRPYPAVNPPLIYILSRSNLEIEAYGATFVVGNAVAYSSAIHVDRCTNFTFKGGVIQGSRSGMTAEQENGGLTLTNIVQANFRDITFSTGWEGLGAPFVGDWIVDTTFSNITMQTCGIGFDVAHLKNVRLNAISAYGLGHGGTSFGTKFFSCIVDPPSAGGNYTGLDLEMSRNISITNCFATNFATGAAIATGVGYTLSGNTWTKMLPPVGGYGIGVFIYYNTGTFTSEGYPASDISIIGDRFIENGDPTTGNGAGVIIDGTAITNSDKISGITITGCVFDNNKVTGILVAGPANLATIALWAGNIFKGINQASYVNATAYNNYTTSAPDAFNFKTRVVIANNLNLWMQDSGGVERPVLGLSPANVTFLRPGSAIAYSEMQSFSGTTLLRATDEGDAVSIRIGSSLRTINLGAADSGGAGYKMLIVPN